MRNFDYCVPTQVVFGDGATNETAALVKSYGGSRVLVVYGGGSVVKSGLLEKITAGLSAEGIYFETFGGVKPNPRLAHARLGTQQSIAMKADLILAVGGGSVIDTAKGIAHGTANPETDIWAFWNGTPVPKSIPIGVVLTIPAAGSETSDSAVLTDEETDMKKGLSIQENRPAFAVMDPSLALTLPLYQVACGITDIMMHTLDRYFNANFDNELTDEFAEGLLRVVVRNGKKYMENPQDVHAMSEIMWCGSVSHNCLTGLGNTKDFCPHQLSHGISAKYDTAHGASLASIWSSWARYVYKNHPERFDRYAKNVWGVEGALAGIQATEDFFSSIGMPVTLSGLTGKLTEAEIDHLTDLCSFYNTRTIGTFQELNHSDMKAIYSAVNV